MDRSLASYTNVKKLRDPTSCKKDGSSATAYDYFHGIQRAHPSAKLGNIAELPRYLRSLVKQSAPEGEWYLSRMLVRGEKHTYDHAGWKRTFFKGEAVWDDPNTGEHILAGDCGNIVAPRPIKPEVPVTAPAPQPTPARVATACPGWTLMLRAYSKQSLPADLLKREEELVSLAKGRDSYRGNALSRTLGKDLYYIKPIGDDVVHVQLLDPQTMVVVEKLGSVRLVGGVVTVKLSDEQHKKIVETIWPANYESPTRGRNRAFPDEWGIDPCPPRVISGISLP